MALKNLHLETFEGRKACPYRALWCAVISKAFEDAAWHPIEGMHTNTKSRGVDTNRARHWFVKATQDFKAVCEFAGFDWEYVQRKYKESFFNGLYDDQKNLLEVRKTNRGKKPRIMKKHRRRVVKNAS